MPHDRLILHTVHTDDGATEVYFGRSSDDFNGDHEGSFLFHPEGGVTYKLWTNDDVPIVVHIEGNRVRVAVTEDQPPFYDRSPTIFDSNDAK